MMSLENTGERILLEIETPLMIARHFCAYRFAAQSSGGKKVLDIGCGEGYGSHYLAGFAKEVLGIDYNKEAIDYAKTKYKKENLLFSMMDVSNLGDFREKFDLVCSFQNIEHIPDTDKLLENIRRLLDDGGSFICSTCNRKDASPGSVVPFNKFHVKEYLFNEFKELLEKHFGSVEIFGLKRGRKLKIFRRLKKIGLFNILPEPLDPVKRFYGRVSCKDFVFVKENIENALDFIAVCKI